MVAHLPDAEDSLRVVVPPYDNETPWPRGTPTLPRGTVVLCDFEALHRNGEAVAKLVRRVRFSLGAAAALRLPGPVDAEEVPLLWSAYASGFRAAVGEGGPLRDTLASTLSRPADLAADWIDWVRAHREVSHASAEFVARIVRHAWEYERLSELYDHLGVPPRTVTFHLKKDGLPKAERWHGGARLLEAQLRLQRDPRLEVDTLATRMGYVDAMSLSNRTSAVFGATAETARKLLGLEWRFREWWKRSARPPPGERQLPAATDFDTPGGGK